MVPASNMAALTLAAQLMHVCKLSREMDDSGCVTREVYFYPLLNNA